MVQHSAIHEGGAYGQHRSGREHDIQRDILQHQGRKCRGQDHRDGGTWWWDSEGPSDGSEPKKKQIQINLRQKCCNKTPNMMDMMNMNISMD